MPVRNEEAGLTAALAALNRQVDSVGQPLDPASFEILVFANNCGDASAEVARRFAADHPRLQLHVVEAEIAAPLAHIGFVRGQLMDAACVRLESTDRGGGIIASTDGDSRVAVDWLAATEAEFGAGADAVGGRIVTDASHRPSAAALRLQRLDTAHSLLRSRLASLLDADDGDPWPRHHQHFGASLAVSTAAYAHVGGLPCVEYLEDEALVVELLRADRRVRHSPQVRVTTSSRLDGRAAVGLSWQLRQWASADPLHAGPMVEPPLCHARALSARRALRDEWRGVRSGGGRVVDAAIAAATAAALGVAEPKIGEALSGDGPFGSIWHVLDGQRLERQRLAGETVPLPAALVALRRLVRQAAAQPLPSRLVRAR